MSKELVVKPRVELTTSQITAFENALNHYGARSAINDGVIKEIDRLEKKKESSVGLTGYETTELELLHALDAVVKEVHARAES